MNKTFMLKSMACLLIISLAMISCKSDTDATAEVKTEKAVVNQTTKKNQLKSGSAIPANQNTAATAKGGVTWNKIDDLEKLAKSGDKKILIDVYTSWCGWCKVMDKKTFTDPEVISYLNENFHVVKFNAEQKQPITYKGKTYEWVPSGRKGVNMLAHEMLNGRLGYPSLVYLDENLGKIRVSPGYKTPDKLLAELRGLEAG